MGLIQLSLFFELRRHAMLKYVASHKFFFTFYQINVTSNAYEFESIETK